MSSKRNRTKPVNLICSTFFIGIILTFTFFFGITAITSRESADASGTVNSMTFNRFSDSFYNNQKLKSLNDRIEYWLFGGIESDDIILGDDGFLFDAGTTASGYNYLRDYVGGITLTDDELKLFSDIIRLRKLAYENRGIDYMLVVIPNAQTIYSEKMPSYMGEISENTMLRQLSAYLENNGYDYFFDATALLTEAKSHGRLLYNNTEDSLNSLGEWYLYDAVCDLIDKLYGVDASRVGISSLSLYSRSADGKELARRAGLATIIPNQTISLSDGMQNKYSVNSYYGTMVRTEFTDSYQDQNSSTLLLEFTDEWDRVLLMPYFSNTFAQVAYKSNHQFTGLTVDTLKPSVAVQFIHEYELYDLLDSNTLLTYNAGLRLSVNDYVTAQPLLLSQCSIDNHTVCVGGEVEDGALVRVTVNGRVVSENYAIGKLFFISVDLEDSDFVQVNITAKVDDKEESSPIELKLYRDSTAKQRTVAVGRNSQLYPTDYSWLTQRLSDSQIEAIQQTMAEKVRRSKQLTGKNTEYVYVIVPDKLTVYPEDAPDELRALLPILDEYKQTNISVRQSAGMKVIDLTDEMKSHRALEKLYSQTDTMLTGFGSYVVYHSLTSYVSGRFQNVKVHELMDFSAGSELNVGGELVSRLGLDAAVISESVLTLNREFELHARFEQSNDTLDKTMAFISYTDDSTLPVAIVLRDAYGTEMLETLAEHFSKMIVLREGEYTVSDELIAEIKPDYIITVRCNGELS